MSGERTLPGLGLSAYWTPGSNGWDTLMNSNLRTLSALTQLAVKSRTTVLPGSPTNGDIYIVRSDDGTNPNKIAVRDNGAWVYITPIAGMRAWVIDEATTYVFDTAWATLPAPMDVAAFASGVPGASAAILRYIFARAVVFPDEFAGSQGRSGVAATAAASFAVKKNGTTVGAVAFAIGATVATFTTTGTTVSFAVGDVLEIIAPASPDATLASIAVTLAGLR